MPNCKECGSQFDDYRELENHYHSIQTVSEGSVYSLNLPDGLKSGSWQAAEAFAKAIAELRNRFPNKQFQLIPFEYRHGAVSCLMAVIQDTTGAMETT